MLILQEIEIGTKIGEGGSGEVFIGNWNGL